MSMITERVVKRERDQAEETLAQLLLYKVYETLPAPQPAQGRYENLLQYLQRGEKQRTQGRVLQEAIEATQMRYEQASALYDALIEDNADDVVDATDPVEV